MAEEAAEQALPQPEEGATGAQPLPRLSVSGVVLSKAQLMQALQVYFPGIAGFTPLPDGDHFSVLFAQGNQSPTEGEVGGA